MYHKIKVRIVLMILFAGFFMMQISVSQAAGLLKPLNGNGSDIHMKTHNVQVTVNNGFCRTEVDQIFVNKGDADMEAVYSFPLPSKASLSELSLWIDGKEEIGEVLEKEKAKKIYEDQKAKGKDSALAEKDDYKTFNVSVHPVRAGAETRVRLVYYQPLEIDLNIGRYVYPLAEGGVDEERIAFWSVDDKVTGSFSFDLTLKSAFPVKDVRVPGYQDHAEIKQAGNTGEGTTGSEVYHVSISEPEGSNLSKDIVFYYRLKEDVPARLELIPYKEALNKEGTFMVVVTPGASLKRIAEGTDWTFILDRSGSMGGEKIKTLADGVSRVIGKMSPNDRFRIITFNDKADDFSGGYINATQENAKTMIERLKGLQASGSTALFAGLEKGCKGLDDDRTTGIVLVTDGVANVGPTQESAFLELLKGYDIRLFTFVIGNSANRPLLNKLAKNSNGFAMNISSSDDIIGRILQAKEKVLHENFHDVELRFHGEKVKELTPTHAGSLYIGQQLVTFGKYNGSGKVDIELLAKISGAQHSWRCTAILPEVDKDNPEIERLWALSSIEDRMENIREKGESDNLRTEVVDLGTKYSLVTDYTSMIVLTKEEIENLGITPRNKERVLRERQAQQLRANAPAKNYRADNSSNDSGMFKGLKAPSISVGSGPLGPLSLAFIFWLNRRKKK
ncbi:MAG: VIT and VWA domain-containing protein [Proteobacteria bacterium]|nr:VIT and VWA domain-containing protein [Pseudomonadota bacterium]